MATSDAPTQPVCALGVSERALSALRDDALSQAEAARLAAHVESCAACRARLAAFDHLAAVLRSEHPPEPDERLWQAISAATDAPAPTSRLRFPVGAPVRPLWSRIATIAAVLLLTIGFVALLSLRRSAPPAQITPTATPAPTLTATPQPTATPLPTATSVPLLPAHPLTWGAVSAPASSLWVQSVLFADDGESAYACAVGPVLHIWRTYNRGASWVPARVVPNDPSMNLCEFVVDASDPSVAALAWQPRGGGAGDGFTGLMTTVDGGATWQAVPSQPFIRIDQLDSRGGVIYALRETTNSSNAVEYHVWASNDRMRTWRRVDHGLPTDVVGFWLQPNGSGMLIVVSDPTTSASQLWLSPDGGATWRQLSVPGGAPSYRPARFASSGMYANGIVARWLQGQFHICVSNMTLGTTDPNSPPPTLTCSNDSGGAWHARALLLLTASDGSTVGANLVAVADDGAVLAYGLGDLYRIAVGSNRWQSLGPLPTNQPGASYCPSPGAGIVWMLHQMDTQNRVYIAHYAP